MDEALSATDEEVTRMTLPDRMVRVRALMNEAYALYELGVEKFILSDGRKLAATVVLFSGGNDSTVLAHLFRERATHVGHANTTVGIEKTRQFVRDTCSAWGIPLLERSAPREEDQYEALVLSQGFPGPGHHYKMFQRLKERALNQVRRELVQSGWCQRVVFLAGRRRTESDRRANVPEFERVDSVVWVSPLVHWTKPDLNTYRLMFEVPRNEVADILHMSGECLCGSFAYRGEREEIVAWFPDDFAVIERLEDKIADRDDIPAYRKTWGWGSDLDVLRASRSVRPTKMGRLCSSCAMARIDHSHKAAPLDEDYLNWLHSFEVTESGDHVDAR